MSDPTTNGTVLRQKIEVWHFNLFETHTGLYVNDASLFTFWHDICRYLSNRI